MRALGGWFVAGAIVGALVAWFIRDRAADAQDRRLGQLVADSATFHVKRQTLEARASAAQAEAARHRARERVLEDEAARAATALAALTAAGERLRASTARAEAALAGATTVRDSLDRALEVVELLRDQVDAGEVQLAAAGRQVEALRGQVVAAGLAAAADAEALAGLRTQDSLSQVRIRELEAGLAERTRRGPRGRILGILPRPQCGATVALTGALVRRLGQPGAPGPAPWELLGAGCTIGF